VHKSCLQIQGGSLGGCLPWYIRTWTHLLPVAHVANMGLESHATCCQGSAGHLFKSDCYHQVHICFLSHRSPTLTWTQSSMRPPPPSELPVAPPMLSTEARACWPLQQWQLALGKHPPRLCLLPAGEGLGGDSSRARCVAVWSGCSQHTRYLVLHVPRLTSCNPSVLHLHSTDQFVLQHTSVTS
jgi:hypothetical protein